MFKKDVETRFEIYDSYEERIASLEGKVNQMIIDIQELKDRPVAQPITMEAPPEINYEGICSRDQYEGILKRVIDVEKRNHEQDDRLTNNELRIEKLEKMIQDPLDRIMAVEQRVDIVFNELKNRVTVQDLYNELMKKADLNGLKALETSLIRMNEVINELSNQFADRVENDKAHKLL